MEINLDEVRAVGEEHYPALAAAYTNAAAEIAGVKPEIPAFGPSVLKSAMDRYFEALGNALLPSAANLKVCGEALVQVVDQLESADEEVSYEFDRVVTLDPDLPTNLT
ncbi:hypothetical protein FB566_1860 [Stackebrandtia endophytica]|uniref:Excreted virulence factor EspC (Type VII ESX diderm) n=1 Tax=Stackebrandtia endophytica TaxID=1496996 RepID=A0A543AUS0_9ACTN|nr:hypothetical protein [Stackebrandtia endophytica]TQL76333.1 hypothetical protein FB566_1860 [Stackebrandtia endophytica]